MAETFTMSEQLVGDGGVAPEKKMKQEGQEQSQRVVVGNSGGGVLEKKKQQEQEGEESHRVVVGDNAGKKKQEEAHQQNTNRPQRAAAAAPFKTRLMDEIFQFIVAVTIVIGFSFAFAAVYSWADKHFNDGRGNISVYRMAMELLFRASISMVPLYIISAYFRLKFPEIS